VFPGGNVEPIGRTDENRSEGNPSAQLDLPARNCAELRGIHKTVRRSQIHFVQAIERLHPKLEIRAFRNLKSARQRQIQGLLAWPVDGVAPGVAEGIRSRRGERQRVEPFRRRPGSRPKHRLYRRKRKS